MITKSTDAGITPSSTGGFVGYAARFLNIDRQGDIILPGAFQKSIQEFMDSGGLVLSDHENKTSAVIGTLNDATEDRSGLKVDVTFSATKAGQDIRTLLREKAVRKMSISFLARTPERISKKQVSELWDRYGYKPNATQIRLSEKGANLIKEVSEIIEVSVVPIPANSDASIISVKAHSDDDTPTPVVDASLLSKLFRQAELADSIMTAAKR